jgi:hypothetical protein
MALLDLQMALLDLQKEELSALIAHLKTLIDNQGINSSGLLLPFQSNGAFSVPVENGMPFWHFNRCLGLDSSTIKTQLESYMNEGMNPNYGSFKITFGLSNVQYDFHPKTPLRIHGFLSSNKYLINIDVSTIYRLEGLNKIIMNLWPDITNRREIIKFDATSDTI